MHLSISWGRYMKMAVLRFVVTVIAQLMVLSPGPSGAEPAASVQDYMGEIRYLTGKAQESPKSADAANAWMHIGLLYYYFGHYQEAITAYESFLRDFPQALSANMRETLTPPEFNVEEGGESIGK
jgi:tetratricopeptide (TPR) repeat protein